MLVSHTILLGASLLLQTVATAPHCTPAEFQDWFHAAAQGKLDIPATVERRAQRFRYVFVGGFANEVMPGYFAQCARELRAHGVPPEAIHYIFPSSHQSFAENSDEVRARFFAIASQGPERLVVIAHSRGARDTLAFALQDKEFVGDHVHAFFLVQGAFGGTGVADYLLGEGSPMDRRMPARLRVIAYLLGRIEKLVLHRGKHEGLTGLTRRESELFWERMREDHADAIPVVGPKSFYITSRVHPSRLRLFHKAIAWYLNTYYGPNDGIVALRDQSLPGLGTCLGVFDAGHTDLTHRSLATRAPRRLRRALIQSIIMAVGRTTGTPEDLPGTLFRQVRRRGG